MEGAVPPGSGFVAALDFTLVDLAAGGDFLWVHDGVDASAPVVTVLSARSSFYLGTGSNTLYPFRVLVSGAPEPVEPLLLLNCG